MATEYKGQMRLPQSVKEKMDEIAELTGNSLNGLVVEAQEFYIALAEAAEGASVPIPRGIVLARAALKHKKSPTILHLSDLHYASDPGRESLRAAEEPPPKEAQARRARGQ